MHLSALPLPDETHRQLVSFADAVRSSPHNLLSQRALDELEERHVLESVAFALDLPRDAGRLLDVGTGGGFPGMVIAIVRPDIAVTLLDATTKKIEFLRELADALQVDVRTLNGRAEELQREHAGSFDVVTARAVAPLERLLPWSLPFLRPGGALYAIKGERWREELRAAMPVVARMRAVVAAVPDQGDAARSGDLAPFSEENPQLAEQVAVARPKVVIIRKAG